MLTAAGPITARVNILLKSFFDKLFSSSDKKLEKMVLKSIAKSLDESGKQISSSKSNEQWLTDNVLPAFKIAKIALATMIITMMFGPRRKMEEAVENSNPSVSTAELDKRKKAVLDSAACADSIFSLSNIPSEPQGDIEFNKVQLKKILEAGNVEFVISCQEIKIKLPENLEDTLGTNSVSVQDNASNMFVNLANFVSQETQKQNVPENTNAVNQSFYEVSNQKIFNLMSTAVGYQLDGVFNAINAENSSINASMQSVVSSPCEITDVCQETNTTEYKQKTAFSSTLINLMYALLISIFFKELVNRIKKLTSKVFVERARRRRERKLEKQKQRFGFLSEAGESIQKSSKFKEALKEITSIFDSIKGL
jgi:hypothetical protein